MVTRTSEPLANSESALRVSVPIVTSARVDTFGDPATVDIQLGKNHVGLPIGFGVVSTTGESKPLSASAAAIKAAVDAVPIAHSKAESAYLSNYTQKSSHLVSLGLRAGSDHYANYRRIRSGRATVHWR
ncbi:hypothetical protein KDX38_00740 [Pseudomonas sp. CDFA 602]|uniref:hypothetical protein n=1 Tax=Pseudomonas californiensis TaxID=2829823 RepID=UPI001E29A5C0|nr:hypothetical protein [Pseudomonas californiensis]MCD5992138.1 hypothetical protein [Pseudomonas californiensis]MCD5997746.1 hypothetical protein [Pseudomonas californiensis]